MVFATIILFVAILRYGGGIENIMNIYNENPNLLSPYGLNGSLTAMYVTSLGFSRGRFSRYTHIAINSMLYKNEKV